MIKNGIDIVEIERIRQSAENPAFLEKVYGEHEREELTARNFAPRHLAGAFAAKEAFSKALGTGIRGFSLCEAEVLHDSLGAPYFLLSGNAKILAERKKLEFSLSITHTDTLAAAVVTAYERGETV